MPRNGTKSGCISPWGLCSDAGAARTACAGRRARRHCGCRARCPMARRTGSDAALRRTAAVGRTSGPADRRHAWIGIWSTRLRSHRLRKRHAAHRNYRHRTRLVSTQIARRRIAPELGASGRDHGADEAIGRPAAATAGYAAAAGKHRDRRLAHRPHRDCQRKRGAVCPERCPRRGREPRQPASASCLVGRLCVGACERATVTRRGQAFCAAPGREHQRNCAAGICRCAERGGFAGGNRSQGRRCNTQRQSRALRRHYLVRQGAGETLCTHCAGSRSASDRFGAARHAGDRKCRRQHRRAGKNRRVGQCGQRTGRQNRRTARPAESALRPGRWNTRAIRTEQSAA